MPTKAKSKYKSGFCITANHDSCTVNYGNEANPATCTCDCHG